MANYTTSFLNAGGNDWAVAPFKYFLIAAFAWLGLDLDIEPVFIYTQLWMFDLAAYSIKEVVNYRRLPVESILFRGLRHFSVLLIIMTFMVLANSSQTKFNTLFEIFMFMASIYLAITTTSSVTTMFTKKEYNDDELIGVALRRGRTFLVRWFRKASRWLPK